MGEYQALSRLSTETKKFVTPLIEIPPPGYDFETNEVKKSLDAHVGGFGKKLKSKWDSRTCLIDTKYIDSDARMVDGTHFMERIFEEARDSSCQAVPVVSLQSDEAFLAVTKAICSEDKRGLCLRLQSDDFDKENLSKHIKEVLEEVGVGITNTDLVIDFGSPAFVPRVVHQRVLRGTFADIPGLSKWRSLVLAGSSYPETLQKVEKPIARIERMEWTAYKMYVRRAEDSVRLPTFSDYCVAHPSLVELDMRFVKPFAKLRYTTGQEWYIAQGRTVREHGFGQYRDMCSALMQEEDFDSSLPSAGDDYIAECSDGLANTGNLSTWVWVATNRHITRVVDDLANLHDSLETV